MKMKISLILLSFSLLALSGYSLDSRFTIPQKIVVLDSMPETTFFQHDQAYYLKKRKTFNTLGWVSLGTGVVLFTGAVVIGFTDLMLVVGTVGQYESKNNTAVGIMATAGGLLMLTSIPLFIKAHSYKKKAAGLAFDLQPIGIPQQKLITGLQPAMKLTIRF